VMLPNLSSLSLSERGARGARCTDSSYDPRYANALSIKEAVELILTGDGQSFAAARRAFNLEAIPSYEASDGGFDVVRGFGWRNPESSALVDSVVFRFQNARTPKGSPFFGGVFELRCSRCDHLGGKRSLLTLHSTGSMGDYDDDDFQDALRRLLPADPLPIAVSVNRVSNNLQLFGMKTARARVVDRIVKAVTELLSEPVEEERVEFEELPTPLTMDDEAAVTEAEDDEAAVTEEGSDS